MERNVIDQEKTPRKKRNRRVGSVVQCKPSTTRAALISTRKIRKKLKETNSSQKGEKRRGRWLFVRFSVFRPSVRLKKDRGSWIVVRSSRQEKHAAVSCPFSFRKKPTMQSVCRARIAMPMRCSPARSLVDVVQHKVRMMMMRKDRLSVCLSVCVCVCCVCAQSAVASLRCCGSVCFVCRSVVWVWVRPWLDLRCQAVVIE